MLPPTEPTESLTPEQAWARMLHASAPWAYLDVRSSDEFAEGHPRGAVNISYANRTGDGLVADPEFVSRVTREFPTQSPIIVACARGPRARLAAQALRDAGFMHIALMPAGWEGHSDAFGTLTTPGWKRSGLPRDIGP